MSEIEKTEVDVNGRTGTGSSGTSEGNNSASGNDKAGSASGANGKPEHSDSGNQNGGGGSSEYSGRTGGNAGSRKTASGRNSGSDRRNDGGRSGSGGTTEGSSNDKTSVLEKTSDRLTEQPKPKTNVKPSIKESKKKSATSSSKSEVTSPDFLSAILTMTFGFVATLSGHKHWTLEKDEADRVADPLSNVLDNLPSKTKNKLNKFSAPILLGSALGSVVVPRLLMEVAIFQKGGVRVGNQPKNGSVHTGVSGQGYSEPGIHESSSEVTSTANTAVDPAISQLLDNVG